MKILMTGGTGHIGSRFIKKFPHHQYCVLTRSKRRAQECLPADIQVIENLHSLDNLNEFDAVINLAGEPIINKRWTAKQKQIICDSRYHITQQLVELFQKSEQPPKAFLSGSAIGVYSDVKESTVHELYTSPARRFAAKLCMDWENIAHKAEPFTRVVYLRTGIVLDKDAGALHKMLLPFKLNLGGPIGAGTQFMSWIHIDDMLLAMEFILTHSAAAGAVNLTSPNAVTNKEFTQALATQLGRLAIIPVPSSLLKLLMGESSTLLVDGQNVLPKKLIEYGYKFTHPKLEDAFADLL